MPRITIGLPTCDRDTYLDAAIRSCLAQDHEDFEVLVVLDGTTNPRSLEIVARHAADPRLRVARHERNRGIAAAINTIVREGRGELIAITGDDDLLEPDRLRRQAAVFDAHPDTGVVHGDALVIDGEGRVTGEWRSRDFGRRALVHALFREHNFIVDSTTMRHRRVHEAVGPADETLPWEDFDFLVKAARTFRYRHCGGGPLVRYRRHGANASDESARDRELLLVETVLERALEVYDLEELVPEVDWPVLDRAEGERQALERLASAFDQRGLPLPELAARVRARAVAIPRTPRRPATKGRLLMTAFGWRDPGGGTTVPRLAAKELARRGWEVTVFHAATGPGPDGRPYEVSESEDDGVRLIGVHDRAHLLLDVGRPDRELDDPPITAAFARVLDEIRPDVVHFHNLHNLGAALIDEAAARGVPSYFTTHNYWLICPRAYLMRGDGALCGGPGDRGADCASCAGSRDRDGHQERLAGIRSRAARGLTAILAVSGAVRRTLLAQGYPADLVDVVRQAMPAPERIWERVGRDRPAGRPAGAPLRVGFFGSAYWHKGPQLLIEAAQSVSAPIEVQIHGDAPPKFAQRLAAQDERGVVDVRGAFHPTELPGLLAGVDVAVLPSMWWDCAPLMAAECLAARVPVIAARMGGLPEEVADDGDGLVFDGRDAAGLAAHLQRLAAEPGELERLQAGIEPPRSFAAYVDDLERCYAGERPGAIAAPLARPAVVWQGDHEANHSLSRVNRAVAGRLSVSTPLQRIGIDGNALDGPLPHAADVEVRHQWPPDLRPPASGRLAVILPWEFGAVPVQWAADVQANVDELWVPSEYVRAMWLRAGIAPDRVHVLPNGVDLETLGPDGPPLAGVPADGVRFLFVGGLIARKGPDVLLRAWDRAFAGRDDVTLVVKDFGAGGIYAGGDRDAIRERARSGALPRVVLLEDELRDDEMAALYRSADVLVHPYRGEGFAMPVLEAMACGRPVIATAGGPTDEFCPPEAGWRVRSERRPLPGGRVDQWETAGEPWMLEPDEDHLVELLREAAADGAGRTERGAAAQAAARALSWERVAGAYLERVRALAQRPPRHARVAPADVVLSEPVAHRLLATPAWRGRDRLAELLGAWSRAAPAGTSAALYLTADPAADGPLERIAARVEEVAREAAVDLDAVADIVVLPHVADAAADAALHAAVGAYVPLHPACDGHERLAHAAGTEVLAPAADGLRAFLANVSQVPDQPADHLGQTATGSRRGTH